jgi:choline-sulfatase
MRTPLLSLLVLACSPPAVDVPPPDILIVTLDTFRADAMGAYGNRLSPTPNLDALAASGARFDRAYTVTPLTIPAHSSIHTGLYPTRHGVRDNGDFYLSDEATTLAERLKGSGYRTMAAVGAEVTSHHWGFSQGFDDLGALETGGNRWRVERPGADVIADAMAWWAEPSTEPRFGWVHLFDAHHPYEAPEPFASQFSGRPYLAEVAGVDALVGELLAAVGEGTVVIVVADHGEGLGDHGENLHGMLLYNATTRIPMLVRGPGIAPQVVQTPASLVDLMPTVLGLAGDRAEGLDGVDLGPHLSGSQPWPDDRSVYIESLYAWRHYGWAKQFALVDADYKFIDSATDKLFERADLRELTNVLDGSAVAGGMRQTLQEMSLAEADITAAEPVSHDADLAAQLAALGYVTAVAEVTSATLADPEDGIALLPRMESVRQAARAGDLDATVAAAEGLIAEDPGLMEPRMILAGAYIQSGNPVAAREVAIAALALQDTASVRLTLGQAELMLGNRTQALTNLEASVRMDPHVVRSWMTWLNALLTVGDAGRLQVESALAVQTLPEQPEIRALAGLGLALTGKVDDAEPLLAAILAEQPDTALVRHGLATVAQERGQLEDAERLYREEIEAFPPGVPSRRHLVALYASQQRYVEQLSELDVIAELEPPLPVTRFAMAQAHFNLRDWDAALADVRTCRELAPELPECALLQANTLKKLDREGEALAALEEARALQAARQSP